MPVAGSRGISGFMGLLAGSAIQRTLVFRTAPERSSVPCSKGGRSPLKRKVLMFTARKAGALLSRPIRAYNDSEVNLEMADLDREPWEPGLKEHLIQLKPDGGQRPHVQNPIANAMVAAS